jgi:hypothetical protein
MMRLYPLKFRRRTSVTQLRMANLRSDRRFHSLFDPSGTTGGLDFDDAILGTGRLVTRFLRAEPGTPAEGLTVFEYFIDLSEVDRDGRSVTAFSLGFDPLVDYLDYNADGTPDHVFVITELSSGSVAPRSADRIGRRITFTFDPPIRPGRPYYDGGMSYPFRMASQYYDYGPWSASVTFDDGSGANV